MTALAIRGHETRGKEVIEILEMLGGKNSYHFKGDEDKWFVLDGSIKRSDILFDEKGFTLEEFFKKYPYKLGDRVKNVYGDCGKVYEMKWIDDKIQYRLNFGHSISGWYGADELQPYKEESLKDEAVLNKWTGLKVELELSKSVIGVSNVEDLHGERFMSGFVKAIIPPEGYQFLDEKGNVINTTKIVLEKKNEYPKTYEECCKVLNLNNNLLLSYNDFTLETPYDDNLLDLLGIFRQLKICRDAYWKIAGEEMGLGKPWEPDYNEESYEQGSPIKYVIYYTGTNITKGRKCTPSYVLSFPTEEMRDAFYENFKSLIEVYKEFL